MIFTFHLGDQKLYDIDVVAEVIMKDYMLCVRE